MDPDNTLPTEPAAPAADPAAPPAQDPPADPPGGNDPPATDPPAGDEPGTGDDPPHETESQRRIRGLIAERKAVEEYAEYWRQQALAGRTPQGAAPAAPEPQDEAAPTLEQFDFDASKWAAAHARWTDKQIEKRVEQATEKRLQKHQQAQTHEQVAAQWQQRVAKFSETHPDAPAVIYARVPITDTMTEVIVASEQGPALAYHLGRNPAEATRISRMSPAQQAAALGRLEATLAKPAAPAPRPRTPTNAPEPPTPIGGSAAPGINLETCSIDEYLAARLGRNRR